MEFREPFVFFKNLKKRIADNDALRFLFFMEKDPKHRVSEGLSVVFLAVFSISTYLAGVAGFTIFQQYTLVGLMLYYLGILCVLLEVLHFMFDR